MRKLPVLALLASAAIISPAARADTPTYSNFTLTSLSDSSVITFTLPFSPTPDSYYTNSGTFNVTTDVTAGGTTQSDIITFYTGSVGGGLSDNNGLFEPYGPQLFSGTLDAPTFLDGNFDLSNESQGGPTDYTLSVSSTPEPSSLMLLGTGVLSMAGVARRRFTR